MRVPHERHPNPPEPDCCHVYVKPVKGPRRQCHGAPQPASRISPIDGKPLCGGHYADEVYFVELTERRRAAEREAMHSMQRMREITGLPWVIHGLTHHGNPEPRWSLVCELDDDRIRKLLADG